MKKCISFMFLFAVSAAFAAQVDRVLVRQQWPWNADVRIEYVVSGLSAPAAVTLKFYDGDSQILVSDATALKGDATYAKNGTNVATFNPKTLFGPAAPAEYSAFKVQVVLGAENEAMGEKLYRIIDLDTGKVEDLTRADFYNGKYGAFETSYEAINENFSTELPDEDVFIWTDVTNNPAYRTSKMVLRKIPAAGIEWMMGTNTPGVAMGAVKATPHLVKLTSDYYIGVFPVTQRQYFKLKGGMGTAFTNDVEYSDHEGYPIYGISYNSWRGKSKYWTVDGSAVDDGSYLDLLREKCGGTILFDLPTEAQWEFACRGGNYKAPVYSGKVYGMNSLKELGWCQDNSKVNDGYQPHVVGKKYPNAYGLYDMVGNMNEWCLDWSDGNDYAWTSKTEPEINPAGVPFSSITLSAAGNGYHIIRGGAYSQSRVNLHSAYRDWEIGSSTGNVTTRVVCPAE